MAERQDGEQQQPHQHNEAQLPSSTMATLDEMLACVSAMEAALLPCLPARELQAIDRSPHPSHQKRHARDFMEAAKKLQLYFIALQHPEQPTGTEALRQEIAEMEEELKVKDELINKTETQIEGWKAELKEQLDKHNAELDRV